MMTIPDRSGVPMAHREFDDAGRMKPGPLYDYVVDVCEEAVKFTLPTRGRSDHLLDRHSERKERDPERLNAVDLPSRGGPGRKSVHGRPHHRG